MTLYEINSEIENLIDKETGEILDVEAYENLTMEKSDKRRNIALLYKNKAADVTALEAEKKAIVERFDARIKRAKNTCEWCKVTLAKEFNGAKYEEAEYKVSFKPSQETVIDDESLLTDAYVTIKRTPNKTAIKAAILKGETVAGAHVTDKSNIIIK